MSVAERQRPPRTLRPLPADTTVHVCTADLREIAGARAAVATTLTSEERDRAAAYRFPTDRKAFVCRRSLLRHLLGGYLGVAPADVPLTTQPDGKPCLAANPTQSAAPLEFSLSGRGHWAVFAFADRAVGVDIETLVPNADLPGIAAQYFHTHEIAWLVPRLESGQWEAFYRLWVCKEAYIKARGIVPLDRFAIGLGATDAPRLLCDETTNDSAATWSFAWLDSPPGTLGVVALAGPAARVETITP